MLQKKGGEPFYTCYSAEWNPQHGCGPGVDVRPAFIVGGRIRSHRKLASDLTMLPIDASMTRRSHCHGCVSRWQGQEQSPLG
jgi:hypothetical protein